ncbi:MAG: hypothetical protein ACRERC_19680 [Candidatus Binatia bacterium]
MMVMRAARAGLLGIGMVLVGVGCGGDDDSPPPIRTATLVVGATATPPPPTLTPTAIESATVAPVPATPTPVSIESATATMCPGSPTPGASATATGSPTATETALICPASTETPMPAGPCTETATASPTGTHPPFPDTPTPGLATLRWFDANPRYTSGVFLPLADYTAASVQVLTTDAWINAARKPSGAAADGATLLLVAVRLDSPANAAPVELRLDAGDLPSGGLFAVDDQRLVDRSEGGGAIDDLPDGPAALEVETVLVDGARWAFALYRAARDYDGSEPLPSRLRALQLSARQDEVLLNADHLALVRPLVVFLHGTGGDTSNWDPFGLWRDSANELSYFSDGVLPFYADRISFQWIALSAGHLADNGATLVPQLGRAVDNWKGILNIAATQADVVTHSYGGPSARQAAQTQPDPDPLTTAVAANFRAATNWGHGLIRKLITMAGTHRGSALSNHTAYLNQLRTGTLRTELCIDGFDIGAGALGDQLSMSPAVRALRETRLPGHAVIGSGTVQFGDTPTVAGCFTQGTCEVCYGASGYHGEYALYRQQDVPNGPYQQAGDLGGTICGTNFYCEDFTYASYERLANYFFNLQYAPPFSDPDCDLQADYPNYDLTVGSCSARGQQPAGAYSTVEDIDPALRGRLSHFQLLTTPAVSDRVRFLLHQPSASEYFAPFAAAGEPTCLEDSVMAIGSAAGLETGPPCASGPDNSLINACYNSCNSCDATADTPPCFVEYRVVPQPLVLRQAGETAPLFVYGRVTRGPLDGQWTNIQSLANQVWCTVAISSDNERVARSTTYKDLSGAPDQSGINVVEAVDDGQTGLTLTVQNKMDGPIRLPVTVDTTLPAAP